MKSERWPILLLALTASLSAADLAPASLPPLPEKEPRSAWVFSLVPKSLQTHPSLDFHVITEMTPDGKKVTVPTPQRPAYFLEQPGQFRQLGNNVPAGEHAPNVVELTRAMLKALATNSYLPATPSSPLPSVVVVFNYGSFARFSTTLEDLQESQMVDDMYQAADPSDPSPGTFLRTGDERDVESLLPMVLSSPPDRTDILQRAELIGGEKFAQQLQHVLNEEASYRESHSSGSMMPGSEMTSPFHQFMNANTETMELINESFSSCYWVVASAYDYTSMRKGKKVLLWRTKMTVNSLGISMAESMPSLIVTAGPYFGREMTDAVTLTRRIDRQGKVEVGEPKVIGYSEPDPAPAKTESGTKTAK